MCNFYQGITTHKNSYDFVTINPIEVVSTKTAMKPAGAKLLDWINRLEDLKTRARDSLVDRREFISALTVSLLAGPACRRSAAGGTGARIAVLGLTPANATLAEAFKQGLGDSGYTEGRNVVIEFRDADGRPERLPQLAADLVRLEVDILFARGRVRCRAVKQATSRIPTVAVDLESDPVAMGFVRNLAQPGGNITGVFLDLPELSGKQLQFLKDVVRPLSRVAILGDPMLNCPAVSGDGGRRPGAGDATPAPGGSRIEGD